MKNKTLVVPVWPMVGILFIALLFGGIISAGTGSWDFWPEKVTNLEVVRAPNGDKVVRMECVGKLGSVGQFFNHTAEETITYQYNLETEEWTPEQRWSTQADQVVKLYIEYTAENAPCVEYTEDRNRIKD